MYNRLYDKYQDARQVVEKFFHEHYVQSVNGLTMSRGEYISHVLEQRNNLSSMKFECQEHLAQDNKIFMIYSANGISTQGEQIEAEVIGFFEFKDKKVIKSCCQVHLIQGKPSDVDM